MLRVELFGRFSACSEECRMPLRDGSKAQELLAYLLLNAGRPHTREIVASVLWDQCSTVASRAYLRKALWQLRSALERCDETSVPCLRVDSEWLQLCPGQAIWADVSVFEQAYREGRGVQGAYLEDGLAEAMEEAVELYGEGLLPNRYENWCLEERERFGHKYLAMRDQLMDYHLSRTRLEEAVEQGRQILLCDNSHERTHRRLMWLHHLRNDRTSALRQYDLCTAALKEELDVDPSEATSELYEKIRDEKVPTSIDKRASAMVAQSATDSLREFQVHLSGLQSSLADMERRLKSLLLELKT